MIDNFALIIGAMKCGTTSLYTYLAQHPEVAPSREKEPDFFGSDEHFARGREWYEGLWDWRPGHTIAMEASTHYAKTPANAVAAERIAAYPARFRLIYLIRNPVDRFESHYNHKLIRGEPQLPLSRGIDPRLVDTSRYAYQLDVFTRHIDRDDILLMEAGELAAAPREVLRRVCRFLGVDPEFQFADTEEKHHKLSETVENPLISRMDRLPLLRTMMGLVPKEAKTLARRVLLRKKRFERVTLTPAQREQIRQELLPDLQRLRDHYGVDVSGWGLGV